MDRLITWLAATRRSKAWIAREIGVTRGLIQQWERGTCRPGPDHRARIEAVTRAWAGPVGWAVLASDWGSPMADQ